MRQQNLEAALLLALERFLIRIKRPLDGGLSLWRFMRRQHIFGDDGFVIDPRHWPSWFPFQIRSDGSGGLSVEWVGHWRQRL